MKGLQQTTLHTYVYPHPFVLSSLSLSLSLSISLCLSLSLSSHQKCRRQPAALHLVAVVIDLVTSRYAMHYMCQRCNGFAYNPPPVITRQQSYMCVMPVRVRVHVGTHMHEPFGEHVCASMHSSLVASICVRVCVAPSVCLYIKWLTTVMFMLFVFVS